MKERLFWIIPIILISSCAKPISEVTFFVSDGLREKIALGYETQMTGKTLEVEVEETKYIMRFSSVSRNIDGTLCRSVEVKRDQEIVLNETACRGEESVWTVKKTRK